MSNKAKLFLHGKEIEIVPMPYQPMKKIYISGKMTGLTCGVIKDKFQNTKDLLINKGYTVVNPFEILTDDQTWLGYMRADIKELVDCDAIYMQKDYQDSKGALCEREIAIRLGLDVIYE